MGQLIYLKRNLKSKNQTLQKQDTSKPKTSKKYLQASMVKQEKKKDNPVTN